MKISGTEALVIYILIAVLSLVAALLTYDLRQSLELPYLLLTGLAFVTWLNQKSRKQKPPFR